MAAFLGRAILGGGAVLYSYRLSNAAIESVSERNKYSRKSIDERMKMRPSETGFTRHSMIQKLFTNEELEFDVVIVGGDLICSKLALDCSTIGLKTLLVDSKDFDSSLSEETPIEHMDFEHLTNINMRSVYQKSAIEDNMSFLCSAPHLSYLSRTRVCYQDLTSLFMGYLRHKFSDLLTNKPPKYSATLTTSLPYWSSSDDFVGCVETYQNNIDLSRLNLLTVLTAASHGAVVLNHVDMKEIENDDKTKKILLSLSDNLSGCDTKIKCKHLVNLKEMDNFSYKENVQCFRVPEHLTEDSISYILTSEGLTLRKSHDGTKVCVHGQESQREAFEKLKSLIKKHFILRKGELTSLPSRRVTKTKLWEIKSSGGTYQEDGSYNPITKTLIKNGTPLLGSHGWYPELSLMLHSKYGLPLEKCKQLANHYGDLSVDIAKEITKHNDLEARIMQSVREMGASVDTVCSRLGVTDKEDVKRVATTMEKELGWSRSFTEDQLMRAEKKLNDVVTLEHWKFDNKSMEHNLTIAMRKKLQMFFRSNIGKNKNIKLFQVEEYLSDENCYLKNIIDDEILETSLRKIDASENGQFNEEEFFDLMQSLNIDTPKEVIDNHINHLKQCK